MDNKLKIREVCGEYALNILFEDMSFNTIYFNSQKKAEAVKRIILDDGNHTMCVTRDANSTKVICLDSSCPHCKEAVYYQHTITAPTAVQNGYEDNRF